MPTPDERIAILETQLKHCKYVGAAGLLLLFGLLGVDRSMWTPNAIQEAVKERVEEMVPEATELQQDLVAKRDAAKEALDRAVTAADGAEQARRTAEAKKVRILTGSVYAKESDFTDKKDKDKKDKGKQITAFKKVVQFGTRFHARPTVQVSISRFNFPRSATVKMHVRAEQVSESGFTAIIETWSEGRLDSAELQWIAYENPEDTGSEETTG